MPQVLVVSEAELRKLQKGNSITELKAQKKVSVAGSKFGKVIDTAMPTHTTPTKSGNGVMLHLKGSRQGYSVYLKNEQLPKVKFGTAVSIREYLKDGKTPSSCVFTVGGIRKWTGHPDIKPKGRK